VERIPRLGLQTAPVGDPAAVQEAAKLLLGASNPVIIVDRVVSNESGMRALVDLAEALQAPVIDKGGRMNFPNRHYLNQTGSAGALLKDADVVLGVEINDLWGSVNTYRDRIVRDSRPVLKKDAKLINIGIREMLVRPNLQDFQRYQPADLDISGDGQATIPLLLEAVRRGMTASTSFADRGNKMREASAETIRRLKQAATYGWDASPISVARLVATIGRELKDENWALVSSSQFQSDWPVKLWNFDKPYQHIGGAGGAGVGYTGPAAIGAALAHRDAGGRFPVAIMGDGELMCCPGTFWTAAHHKIPLLMVMHNNRAYHQEVMHVQRMAARHGRGIDNINIGTTLDNPNIDFAKMADSMGVWSKGPITDPADLAPALRQAIAMVKQGLPALVDVVCQPR
jgi:thiamine pyrophosphate-dependent acetolactate synthase large subunit-like protein